MKTLFPYMVASIFLSAHLFASTGAVLNCTDSSENITIDGVQLTIERGGVTYPFLTKESFFGSILDPINPSDGIADLDWSIRAMGAIDNTEINASASFILDTNGGTVHSSLSCKQTDQ